MPLGLGQTERIGGLDEVGHRVDELLRFLHLGEVIGLIEDHHAATGKRGVSRTELLELAADRGIGGRHLGGSVRQKCSSQE